MMRNDRVTIERPSTTRDGAGQPLLVWSTVATAWANVRYLNGVETIKAGAETAIAKASIRIGFRSDIDPSMRVRFGTAIFSIKTVLPGPQRQHVDLVCEVIQ